MKGLIKYKANLTDEALIPKRIETLGSACSEYDLEEISRLESHKWEEIVPITALCPGYEDTRYNFQKVRA